MSTMGPLHPEQLTREETLDKASVGPYSVKPTNELLSARHHREGRMSLLRCCGSDQLRNLGFSW
jgi:hypothetical protein